MVHHVYVNECEDGDVIIEDVYIGKSKIPTVVKHSVVDTFIRSKLENLTLGKVKIIKANSFSTPLSKDKLTIENDYKEMIGKFKMLFLNIAMGKEISWDQLSEISKSVIEQSDGVLRTIETLHNVNKTDEYTFKHSINVAIYAMFIGRWLNLRETEIKDLVLAGLLHDIGKARIPVGILNKKGMLTKEEYSIIKEHSSISYDICKKSQQLSENVKEAVLLHHEREDGSGYPLEMNGESINKLAKIVGIADVYDALTSERVYKTGMSPFDTFDMMLEQSYEGKMDMTIIDVFIKRIAPFYIGTSIQTNNGKKGEVVFIPPHNITSPIIKVGNQYFNTAECQNYRIFKIIG